ncbi:myosin-7-like [Argopecten irradians]|uniref:myosin-7-like n=1 Tax=Argopecten irradians TaxID=31199 RepID=UPI003712B426
MAAETVTFDSSFDSEHREDEIDRMVGDVLEDSFEEIPEASDEFWKPVITTDTTMHRTENVDIPNGLSLDSESDDVRQSEYPLPVNYMVDNNCSCFDEGIQSLRRSRSEDILSKNQEDNQITHFETYPMHQNFVTTPDKKSDLSDSLQSVDENVHNGNFLLGDKGFKSFFDEFDKKLDCLETKHTAIDDSFSGIQSILMEFENFVTFIENQYEKYETPETCTRAAGPSANVTIEIEDTETDSDKFQEDRASNIEENQNVSELDCVKVDIGKDNLDKNEEENDLDKCDNTVDKESISTQNDNVETCEEKTEETDIETNSNKENEDNNTEQIDEVEKNEGDEDKQNEAETVEGDEYLLGPECQDDTKCNLAVDMRSFMMCLNSALQEMFSRFQEFVNEVGETVHLGALATQHSQRMDSWASHVQRLYNSLKTDHNNMQEYIDQKEKDWIKARTQLHSELEMQGRQINEVISALKQQDDIRRKSERILNKRVGDRLLLKSELGKTLDKLDNSLVDILQKRRCDQEHAMALDFSRQLKIAELKMILLKQQSYIQKLELQNKELDGVLRGVLFDPDTEQFGGNYFVGNPGERGEGFNTMTDILHCDKANYFPGKSTDAEMVGAQTFDIGTKPQRLSAEREVVFDPKMLKYMCQETLAAINSDISEIGSGEKVIQQCDPDVVEVLDSEVIDTNNSGDEVPTKVTIIKPESTEDIPDPVLDINGNINLSLI